MKTPEREAEYKALCQDLQDLEASARHLKLKLKGTERQIRNLRMQINNDYWEYVEHVQATSEK